MGLRVDEEPRRGLKTAVSLTEELPTVRVLTYESIGFGGRGKLPLAGGMQSQSQWAAVRVRIPALVEG